MPSELVLVRRGRRTVVELIKLTRNKGLWLVDAAFLCRCLSARARSSKLSYLLSLCGVRSFHCLREPAGVSNEEDVVRQGTGTTVGEKGDVVS